MYEDESTSAFFSHGGTVKLGEARMTLLRPSFHVFCIAALTYPYYWITTNPNKINDSYGWQFQMFTIVTLSIAYLQFFVALLQDLAPSPAVASLKRTLLLVAGPCETLVSVLYWGIRSFDAGLLAPPDLLALFPLSADLSMHAVPTVLLLIEMFCFSEAIETRNATAGAVYGLYAVAYYFWTERNARLNGWYPYPMLDLMTTEQRVGTFAGATGIAFLSFLALKKLHAVIHGGAPGIDAKVKH